MLVERLFLKGEARGRFSFGPWRNAITLYAILCTDAKHRRRETNGTENQRDGTRRCAEMAKASKVAQLWALSTVQTSIPPIDQWTEGSGLGELLNTAQRRVLMVLLCSISAINGQWYSSDPFCFVAGQKDCRASEIVDLAKPAQRVHAREDLRLISHVLECFGQDCRIGI